MKAKLFYYYQGNQIDGFVLLRIVFANSITNADEKFKEVTGLDSSTNSIVITMYPKVCLLSRQERLAASVKTPSWHTSIP